MVGGKPPSALLIKQPNCDRHTAVVIVSKKGKQVPSALTAFLEIVEQY
jgi:hypothetical protein